MLNMAIAWKRVGGHDYGIYLTRGEGPEDHSPACTWFKASYSARGEIVAFHVKDGLSKEGAKGAAWDGEHIRSSSDPGAAMDAEDLRQIESLAGAFVSQWIEPFGQSEALSALRRLGFGGPVEQDPWRAVLGSGLPAEIKRGRLPDVLSLAESTEHGFLYAFLPYPERLGQTGGAHALLEAKMRLFFELL